MTSKKPLYIIAIENGYYSAQSAWRGVSREQADKLTHKQALQIRNKLACLRFQPSIESYKETT